MEYKIWNNTRESVPTVYVHSFRGEGATLWETCQRLKCPPFNLVALHHFDGDRDLTPWEAENVRPGQPAFGGKAGQHLKELLENILPQVEAALPAPSLYISQAGYSLAGLFTLWCAAQTHQFDRIACVSASFWYPGLLEQWPGWLENLQLHSLYFSLGNKESKTPHPLMRQVREHTQTLYEGVAAHHIPTIFEINPGNHFTEPDLRMAKAIKWCLEQ